MNLATWVDDLAAYLAAQDYGKLGREITTGQISQDADPCKVSILVTPAAGLSASCALDRPRVQVVTRCRNFLPAWQKIEDLYDLLKMHGKAQLGSTLLVSCTAIQTPFPLGMDESKCWRFACNFQLELGN